VRRAIKAGELAAVRHTHGRREYRISRESLAAWIAARHGAITALVHDLVAAAGGSISAEHGIGVMKRADLARLGDPARVAAMRAVKSALDPHNIMNPGKIY
jgi:excisionase family DNA binding protein